MRSVSSLHTRITDATSDLAALLERLEAEIPEKKRSPHGGFGSPKGGHGPLAAWNGQAAMLVLDVHAGLRDIEADLQYATARVIRPRGGSDGNTLTVLDNLPRLAAGAHYDMVAGACRKMESWIYRARLILGDLEPFSRLPRLPGQAEPSCPFCRSKGTLRVRHATGTVICLRPDCRDSEGRRPAGRIDLGSYSHEPILAWNDGTMGVAA